MNKELLHTEVQKFINSHLKSDLTKLILKGSPYEKIPVRELAEQIHSKSKCRDKLPTWFKSEAIYYPPSINIEQTSSELAASYKSTLISGGSLIDITGGYGVDSYYFSKTIEAVTHCELDMELSSIAAHNFRVLNLHNITCENLDGIERLKKSKTTYDWIYVDPSRRNENMSKVFRLEDCLPDLTQHLDLLLERSAKIMVKLSPFLDISTAVSSLKFVTQIHVVAVKNEVKELIFIVDKKQAHSCEIKAVNLVRDGIDLFESSYPSKVKAMYSLPKKYLYEPNSAILKAGIFNEVSVQLNLYKLHVNSHLYTSNNLFKFPGRRFEIKAVLKYDKKLIKQLLPSSKANFATRNFPETVAQIRKKTGIHEGGDDYLFFTTDAEDKTTVIQCKKV